MDYDRRSLLRIGGLAALGAVAGCSGSNDTQTNTATGTATGTSGGDSGGSGGASGTPGIDQLGGPNDLQSSAQVEATTLDSDQGAGQYVYTPGIVWVEPGATITWTIGNGSHSITAYHADNGKSQRIPDGAASFDSGVLSSGSPFRHTFETEGVYNYYCTPHEGLGMTGLVVVGGAQGGPGTTSPTDLPQSSAASSLTQQLAAAGITTSGGDQRSYTFQDATLDSYWYSLYNMSTNIAMSGNGVPFPLTEQMEQLQSQRMPAMLEKADTDRPPINNPNLSFAAFTEGDPHFTQTPVLEDETGRPNGETLAWDTSASSGVVSPSSLAWTHLKGVTWAKNFQAHFDVLPAEIAAKFRAQLLATLAQVGINAAILVGGSRGNGALTHGDSWEFLSQYRPSEGVIEDETRRPHHHAAMLWFLSDMTSLAQNGWFGYVNPKPLLPREAGADSVLNSAVGIQEITDGVAGTTMDLFSPADIVSTESTRSLGLMLGAVGYYGPQAGSGDQRTAATEYANSLASEVEANLAGNGKVENGAANQAATQGIVGQGLLWASELDGVDHTGTAEDVLGYMTDELWDADAGTYISGTDADTYTITARDAGDITGGLNAADAVVGTNGVKAQFAQFFDQTFNRGRLQRAQRKPSANGASEHEPPMPPKAGGEFGQAAVYNAAVEYDTSSGEWAVTDDRFDTEWSLYLANQDIWIGNWSGDFFQGRGRPGHSDSPPNE